MASVSCAPPRNMLKRGHSMNTHLTSDQIQSYRENGFVVLHEFLSPDELREWREAVDDAVGARGDLVVPGHDAWRAKNDFYSRVFKQRVNLWQTSERMQKIMVDERLGKLATELAGVDGIRIWHDQA